jgi:WD40 repeat protein
VEAEERRLEQARHSLLTDRLPLDALALVLVQLGRAAAIARVAPTCRALRDAARAAERAHRRVCYEGHTTCVAAAPDGRVITGFDKTIKVWRDGACERTIEAHGVNAPRWFVSAVAVLPGGARFVSCSHDGEAHGTAKLFTFGGELERTFEVHGGVTCVAVMPDGVHFVVGLGWGSNEGEVWLYHVDGTRVHTFTGPHLHRVQFHTVRDVAVTPDGQHIISCDYKNVNVWSVASKSLASSWHGDGDTGWVVAVAATPDGQRFLSGSHDHPFDFTVRVWRLNGTLENTFRLHTGDVRALVALPDNQHALSGSDDKTVKLFNVNDGAVVRSFLHHTDRVSCLALLSDGRRFVSGSWDGTARIVEHGLVL